jgi:hypothetical protein
MSSLPSTLSALIISVYFHIGAIGVVCCLLSGLIVNIVWRRKFHRELLEEEILWSISLEKKLQEATLKEREFQASKIKYLESKLVASEQGADEWHKKAIVALRLANKLNIDNMRTTNISPEKLAPLVEDTKKT